MKIKVTTATTLVLEYLQKFDGLFATAKMINAALPQLNGNQVSAALYHLRKYHAADFVVETDKTLWWFARDKQDDQRSKHVDERTPESKKRNRKSKQKVSK